MNRPRQLSTRSRSMSARPQPITSIGSWHLVRKLGEGRWTDVYQARPVSSGDDDTADYVVKTLQPEHRHDPLAIQTLQREAYVAGLVRHPHLSSILSSQIKAPPYFVVMPFIEGVSAADALLTAGRFTIPQALWIVRQAAEGLRALHRAGWLHNDVKSANVVISPNGHATLIDLGFARPFPSRRTQADVFEGSLAYACPESFLPNVPFSATSDVYSLGIMLFELLTANRPFRDDNPTDLSAAHLVREIPSPRSIVPQIPARVVRLIRQMLAKDPLRRPSTQHLIDWLTDLEVETFSERSAA